MSRNIIGYKPDADKRYKISEEEYEIITSHPVQPQNTNEYIPDLSKSGFLSDERIDVIGKLVMSL